MLIKSEETLFVQGIEVDLENEQGVRRVGRGSSPESVMAASPEHRRNSSSASSYSSSAEVPGKYEQEIFIDTKKMDSRGDSQEAAGGDDSRAGVDRNAMNKGGAESVGTIRRSFCEVGTSPVGTSNIEKLYSSQRQLEISKTEAQSHKNMLVAGAAQSLGSKIPAQQKFKMLDTIAAVKGGGTVKFEVQGDVEPHALGGGTRDAYIEVAEEESLEIDIPCIPPLQVVMLIVGTPGDVQPFIAIGKRLQDYGHRVRLATHSNFKDFVLTAGLEFYPLGGDPRVLAGYIVKNKSFLPSGPFEIHIQRNQMKEIIYSLLPACKDCDPDSGIPFVADAIIANPPAYGHTHVAEALKLPIHIFSTMPWTPTTKFPHPLSRVKQSAGYRLSYQIVDSMIWLGIRDIINDFRKKKLKLRPVTYLSGSQGPHFDVPRGYMWSPHLVPKPKDWAPKVDVVGFCFPDLATNYEPPQSLINWLADGEKPIYIGLYEVFLETSGTQQLGWATISCPFTDHKGVGDADDSYAFDGKRIMKWNKEAKPYGQLWVAGDVIGCCIDLDRDEISFYRNGVSLGLAFSSIRKMGPGFGYYPAVSLSQGERCELNFGARPFKYPIDGYLPLQAPPSFSSFAKQLLDCLSRLLDMQSVERAEHSSVEKLRRLKRFVSLEELFYPVSYGICEELFSAVEADCRSAEYIGWGPLLLFLMGIVGIRAPHDWLSLDRVLDVFLEFQGSHVMFEHIINALSRGCKTASLVLSEWPYSGSYSYLALACHLLRREQLMVLWWKSSYFDFLFEGFLSWKSPNSQDLMRMIPYVWWPGSCEDMSAESSMLFATTALSDAISKIEEKHRELCLLVIQFIPPISPPQFPGSVFRKFVQNLLLKNRGADRNMSPPRISSNSVLTSLYTVILHFLSEGFGMGNICGWLKSCDSSGRDVGFLHRGGHQSFPIGLFIKNDPHRADISRLGGSFNHLSKSHPVHDQEAEVIRWEEGCMDDEETRVTHSAKQKPCCCSCNDMEFTKCSKYPIRTTTKSSRHHCSTIPERSAQVAAECSTGSLNDDIADKPSSSDQPESEFGYHPVHHIWTVPRDSDLSSTSLREEELLDALLLLYHIGLAPNFKQASYYISHQPQLISLLEETDRQIREGACSEQLKHLKENRNAYRVDVIDCVRHCAWYRVSLFSRWKQRGMYAMCMWIVQLLLVLSKLDSVFIYVPEFYIEALVDCFHVLRKSDPPFVPSAIFIKQGLTSFVTFVVTHFDDPRISSADLRDLLLQSISVLVQYREYLAAFENNEAAKQRMPKALLSAFDNRSWIPVTNILLRLCKGSGFGSSKHGESSSSSVIFQRLLREACINDEELFSAFLNRLFNTLSWTMTEFSVSIREMLENYQLQRNCCVIFDLSCNLARVLEFCTHEIPQAFLKGPDTNLRRLTELIVFVLNHITSAADAEFFELSLRRHGQSLEKVSRGMILAPLVGIIANLLDAGAESEFKEQNDVVGVFASMDCPEAMHYGFRYMLEYNWATSFRGETYVHKLFQLENFLSLLISRTVSQKIEEGLQSGEGDGEDGMCCICYASEADAKFAPCSHRSCYGCITRHLLNCQRCFFCKATVLEVIRTP